MRDSPTHSPAWLAEAVRNAYGPCALGEVFQKQLQATCQQAALDFAFPFISESKLVHDVAWFLVSVEVVIARGRESHARQSLSLAGAVLNALEWDPLTDPDTLLDEFREVIRQIDVAKLGTFLQQLWRARHPPPAPPPRHPCWDLPCPSEKAILREWKLAEPLFMSGELARYPGRFIAFLGGKVVGQGPDDIRLREEVAEARGIHPAGVLTMYVEGEDSIVEIDPR